MQTTELIRGSVSNVHTLHNLHSNLNKRQVVSVSHRNSSSSSLSFMNEVKQEERKVETFQMKLIIDGENYSQMVCQ